MGKPDNYLGDLAEKVRRSGGLGEPWGPEIHKNFECDNPTDKITKWAESEGFSASFFYSADSTLELVYFKPMSREIEKTL